jgi:GNAT superfamily N-acetyltransferase
MGRDGDLVTRRLARGCRCFVVGTDDQLAGYGWVSVGPEWIGELELEITPGAHEGYIWNCVTIPAHRRRGVFRSLLLAITGQGRAEGLKRMWIGSVAIPAEKAVGPSGFKAALVFTSAELAGWRFMRIAPSPGADPALVSDALRVLSVRPGIVLRRSHPRRH